ncbi:DUF2683 family protein [Cyclonatronum proteinivorum]|nr:DUF2683 family protein [Cyclonatronum proteinivorum]
MKSTTKYITKPKNHAQKKALLKFMKAFNIPYEIHEEHIYELGFVEKIEVSKAQYKRGLFTRIEKDDIDNLLGISH